MAAIHFKMVQIGLAALFILFFMHPQYVRAHSSPVIILTVKTSSVSQLESQLMIKNNQRLFNLFKGAVVQKVDHSPATDIRLVMNDGKKRTVYAVDDDGYIYDELGHRMDLRSDLKKDLLEYVRSLRFIHYGDMLTWKEADKAIPLKKIFKVIDIETGLQFNVQRRAGKHHADVQPMTKEDTYVMKRIYNDAWSWRRRAILVQIGNQLIAASMHGMPHGGDGIPDNHFNGHFCIHFYKSTTHGTKAVDLEHQLMVQKAAGKLEEYIDSSSPHEIVNIFFIAVNTKENEMMKMTFPDAKHAQLAFFVREIQSIIPSVPIPQNADEKELMAIDLPVQVQVIRKGQKNEKMMFQFHLKRTALTDPWKIDFISITA